MSKTVSKFTLAASIVLALAFTSAFAAKQTVAVLPSDGILNEDELKIPSIIGQILLFT